MNNTIQSPFVGKILGGKYRLIRPLSHGGMGQVFLAEHIGLRTLRAIKIIHASLVSDPTMQKRFLHEVKMTHLVSEQNHHVVRVHDVYGFEDGVGFYVMEYLEGTPLSQHIKYNLGNLPISWIIRVTTEICSAMDAAHRMGIIHRDLKPDNILLVQHGNHQDFVKVIDFGIAKMNHHVNSTEDLGVPQTEFGTIAGTLLYMSPEQIEGPHSNAQRENKPYLDGRSDIYSLGCILFEMLTGRPPFVLKDPSSPLHRNQILIDHICTTAPLVRDFRSDVPKQLEDVVAKTLEKPPTRRFASMGELADALLAIPITNDALAKPIHFPPSQQKFLPQNPTDPSTDPSFSANHINIITESSSFSTEAHMAVTMPTSMEISQLHHQHSTIDTEDRTKFDNIKFPAIKTAQKYRIFFSYRREDQPDFVARVYDRLIDDFAEQIFFDEQSINYTESLENCINSIKNCELFLLFVGKNWLDGTTKKDLSDEDWVAREIRCAKQHGITILTILIGGVTFPEKDRLPKDLQELHARKHFLMHSGEMFEDYVARLKKEIRRHLRKATLEREIQIAIDSGRKALSKASKWVISALVIVLLFGVLWAFLTTGIDHPDKKSTENPQDSSPAELIPSDSTSEIDQPDTSPASENEPVNEQQSNEKITWRWTLITIKWTKPVKDYALYINNVTTCCKDMKCIRCEKKKEKSGEIGWKITGSSVTLKFLNLQKTPCELFVERPGYHKCVLSLLLRKRSFKLSPLKNFETSLPEKSNYCQL